MGDKLATPAEVAEYLGTTVPALAQMRYRGTGPEFIKLTARKVRYEWTSVRKWLEEGRRSITGDAA